MSFSHGCPWLRAQAEVFRGGSDFRVVERALPTNCEITNAILSFSKLQAASVISSWSVVVSGFPLGAFSISMLLWNPRLPATTCYHLTIHKTKQNRRFRFVFQVICLCNTHSSLCIVSLFVRTWRGTPNHLKVTMFDLTVAMFDRKPICISYAVNFH